MSSASENPRPQRLAGRTAGQHVPVVDVEQDLVGNVLDGAAYRDRAERVGWSPASVARAPARYSLCVRVTYKSIRSFQVGHKDSRIVFVRIDFWPTVTITYGSLKPAGQLN